MGEAGSLASERASGNPVQDGPRICFSKSMRSITMF
jgi:hypothetical protein